MDNATTIISLTLTRGQAIDVRAFLYRVYPQFHTAPEAVALEVLFFKLHEQINNTLEGEDE